MVSRRKHFKSNVCFIIWKPYRLCRINNIYWSVQDLKARSPDALPAEIKLLIRATVGQVRKHICVE